MNNVKRDGKGKIFLALISLYIIWGSTYLAIRLALEGFPPFMMAGLRFLLTGGGTYLFLRARGRPVPHSREWIGGKRRDKPAQSGG